MYFKLLESLEKNQSSLEIEKWYRRIDNMKHLNQKKNNLPLQNISGIYSNSFSANAFQLYNLKIKYK